MGAGFSCLKESTISSSQRELAAGRSQEQQQLATGRPRGAGRGPANDLGREDASEQLGDFLTPRYLAQPHLAPLITEQKAKAGGVVWICRAQYQKSSAEEFGRAATGLPDDFFSKSGFAHWSS